MSLVGVAGRWIWAALSLVGFAVSLGVHVSTFFAPSLVDLEDIAVILFLGVFAVVLPFIFVVSSSARNEKGRGRWSQLFQRHPPWVLSLVYALFAYALVNLAIDFFTSRGGVPTIVDGQPVLESHGRVVRQLSEEEYAHHQALATRSFSGLWLLFYGIPLLYSALDRGEEKQRGNLQLGGARPATLESDER